MKLASYFRSKRNDNSYYWNFILFLICIFLLKSIPRRKISFKRTIIHAEHVMNVNKSYYKYEKPWFIEGYNDISEFNQVISPACTLCKFSVRNKKSNSTPRDAVLLGTFNLIYNVIPIARTLRTTGCKASLVYFVEVVSAYKLKTTKVGEFLKSCGATFINLGLIDISREALLPLRNCVLYDFLKTRKNVFHRVLIVDLFDTIFQGDPFHSDLNESEIGVCAESLTCGGSQQWGAELVFGHHAKKLIRQGCVNAGTIIGTASLVCDFLGYYVAYLSSISPYIMNQITDYPDQVLMNLLTRFDLTGIPIHFYKNEDDYSTLCHVWDYQIDFMLGDFKINNTVNYPLVIHIFDRVPVFVLSVLLSCPPEFAQHDGYIRYGT